MMAHASPFQLSLLVYRGLGSDSIALTLVSCLFDVRPYVNSGSECTGVLSFAFGTTSFASDL